MKPSTIQLNKAHFPVTTLGPGRRIGLWLQGCSIGCKGCVSQDTWPRDSARAVAVYEVVAWCRQVAANGLDGVTISGGEPFEQPQGLLALLRQLQGWRRSAALDFDILCYSGLPLRTLQQRHAAVLRCLDAVLAEPYVQALPTDDPWRGSANQVLEPLSARGRQRYAAGMGPAAVGSVPGMDASDGTSLVGALPAFPRIYVESSYCGSLAASTSTS